jgi:hypothetical protein
MEGFTMRLLPALLGLCLVLVLPAGAASEILWHTFQYHVVLGDRACAPVLDADQQAVFVTTEGDGPSAQSNPVARVTARTRALKAAQDGLFTGIRKMKITTYATIGDLFDSAVFQDDLQVEISQAAMMVAERWDVETHHLVLVSALPCSGIGSPLELAARMLEIEQADAVQHNGQMQHDILGMRMIPGDTPKQYSPGPYTGIVIDTTGMRFTPALLLKFITADTKEVWGTAGVSAPLVMKKGEYQIMRNLDDARVTYRAGNTPYIIRPVGVSGPLEGDLVLSNDDATALLTPDLQKALANFAIVIVTD